MPITNLSTWIPWLLSGSSGILLFDWLVTMTANHTTNRELRSIRKKCTINLFEQMVSGGIVHQSGDVPLLCIEGKMEVVGSVFTGIVGKSISCCSSFLLSIDTIDFRYFASFHRVRFSVRLSMFCFYPKTKCLYCTVHETAVCVLFSISGFAVFYFVIFRLFGIVLKHCNICFHLCICLPCFRISFPCIFYLFSIVFVYIICSLKFRRFRLSCFTMCAHCLYIHRFRCFSVFVLFFPSFHFIVFPFFSSCFPSIFRVFACVCLIETLSMCFFVCFFLLCAVGFFCFSILYFNCTKQKYLYFCRLFCYFIGKRTGAASLNGLSLPLILIFYVFLLIVLDSFYHSTSSLSTSL